MSFSGYRRNIYGVTPVKILHAVLLDVYDYIADGMKLSFTNSNISKISNTTAGICKDTRCQSELFLI